LACDFSELFGKVPGRGIGATAWWEGHHEFQRFGGKVLRLRGSSSQESQAQQAGSKQWLNEATTQAHAIFLSEKLIRAMRP
jgi:hypothetical protein